MIAIIKTPLQLICAVEYAFSMNISLDKIDFIYFEKYNFSNIQMTNSFNYLNIKSYKRIKIFNSNIISLFGKQIILRDHLLLKIPIKIGAIIQQKIQQKRIEALLKKHNSIIIGDPNYKDFHKITNSVSNKEIILLDDGLSSKGLDFDYLTNNNSVTSFSFLRTPESSPTSHIFLKNNFSYLKSIQKSTLGEKIIFIGQPLLEAKLFTEEEINYFFKIIGQYYSNSTIEYIPHRWELSVNKIKYPENFSITKGPISIPLELYLTDNSISTKTLLSFYSSALVTLKEILPDNIEIISIDLQKFVTNKDILEVYQIFRNKNIQILDIVPKNDI